jgi:hypothetical protein
MQAAANKSDDHRYDDLIVRALATDGGHLSIGRGGFILWYDDGARLSGYDAEPIKAAYRAAGAEVFNLPDGPAEDRGGDPRV